MTISEMFGQSAVLALLGMAVVFGFLVILILAVTFAGKVIHLLGLDRDAVAAQAAGAPSAGSGAVVAAISAAVQQYRKEKNS